MEHQNIEYKQGWRDEYIKWICGFANALKIIQECKKAKINPPEFKYDPPGFVVEFTYPEIKIKKPELTSANNAEKILVLITENGQITVAELIEKVGLSERTIKRIIKQLREANKIQRLGSDKTGEWKIVK